MWAPSRARPAQPAVARGAVPVMVLLAGLAALSCGRTAEETWVADPPLLPLLQSLSFTSPAESPMTLRRVREPGEQEAVKVRTDHEVRMRGSMLPAMVTEVEATLDVTFDVEDVEGPRATLGVRVSDADVTMDPIVDGAVEEMTAGFLAASLRLVAEPGQALAPQPPAGRGPTPTERELAEVLVRLVPALPSAPVAAGDTWPFSASITRSPAGGHAEVRFDGTYTFRGMADFGGRTFAAVELAYAVRGTGASDADGVDAVLSGDGTGRGVYLIDPVSGAVARSQVAENSLLRVSVGQNRRRSQAEQLALLIFDLETE